MLGKLKKNYFLLISTFLILYFFFNLLDGERGLFSYFKKKEILIKDEKCKDLLRKELDIAEGKCLVRIKNARKGNKSMNQIVDCEDAKAIMPHCKRSGRW